eukprot:scaffold1.g5391.t1
MVALDVAAAGGPSVSPPGWLELHCAAAADADGSPVSPLPDLLAAALDSHMARADAADAAREMRTPPYLLSATRTRCGAAPTKLQGSRTPAISIHAYAHRLMKYCGCSPVCFIAAYAYCLRLAAAAAAGSAGGVRITPHTAHRLFATGTVLAIKMCEDKYYTNSHYAQVAGVPLAEMNAMEIDMLQRLGYRARVDAPELVAALQDAHACARQPALLPALPAPPPGGALEDCGAATAAVPDVAACSSSSSSSSNGWWDGDDTASAAAAPAGQGGTPRRPIRRIGDAFAPGQCCRLEAVAAAAASLAERERTAGRQVAVDA